MLSGVQMDNGKYKDWLTDEGLTLISGWARAGLNNEQIAKNIGVNISTFYAWQKKHEEFSEVLKKSKEVADFEVENALYKSALEGNTTAQIFWLKNRMPDKWRDKQDLEVSGDLSISDVIRRSRERMEKMENDT